MIDHRELLKKYMAMVGECEGVTFVYDHPSLSEEEYEELRKIEEEGPSVPPFEANRRVTCQD